MNNAPNNEAEDTVPELEQDETLVYIGQIAEETRNTSFKGQDDAIFNATIQYV